MNRRKFLSFLGLGASAAVAASAVAKLIDAHVPVEPPVPVPDPPNVLSALTAAELKTIWRHANDAALIYSYPSGHWTVNRDYVRRRWREERTVLRVRNMSDHQFYSGTEWADELDEIARRPYVFNKITPSKNRLLTLDEVESRIRDNLREAGYV
jgi:hypothetical protein